MERLRRERPSGLTNTALRTLGLLFLTCGIAGVSILERKILGIGNITNQQLLDAMQGSSAVMAIASLALVLRAIQTCAVPVFCFLLVEGFARTANLQKYMLRVAGLAVLTEIPFNFAMSGTLLDFSTRNPVFAMLLCLFLLYFYDRYRQRTIGNVVIKVVVTVAAFLWTAMLSIEQGACCVILTLVIWIFRRKPAYRDFVGAVVAVLCCIFSPYYVAAPMGFLLVHFYNGEKGQRSRIANYLAYPAVLAIIGTAAYFLI